MFRDGQKPKFEQLDILLNGGGAGDHIAALPAVIHAAKQNTRVTAWVPDYLHQFARTVLPTHIAVEKFKNIKRRNTKNSAVQTLWGNTTAMRMHLVDYASTAICDTILDAKDKNYLKFPVSSTSVSEFNLPDSYVVLTPGFTAEVREMLPETVNKISDHLLTLGITPVYLGTEKPLQMTNYDDPGKVIYKGSFRDSVDYSKGLNLVNKTTLNEACAIMGRAKAVIGLDNGLLHLAGCTDVPIIGGFTTVDPKFRMPYRNDILGHNFYPVVPPESLGCRFCQSNWSFVYSHDFKTCYYKDLACIKQFSADKYIDVLEKLL